MKLLVVGAGEMGRWFARTVRSGLSGDLALAFADVDPGAARAAASEVGGRAVPTDTDDRFDVVCVAVPIPAATTAIREYADRAERAVVDVTGVMDGPAAAMAEAAPTLERASFHPLFAASNAPGSVAAVVGAPGPVTDRIRDALRGAGNDVFETTADEHDRAMETIQARTHAAVLAFGLAAEDVPDEFQTPVSSRLFDLVEEVTANDPAVYAHIQATFDGADDVRAAAERIATADGEAFERLYREANPRRSRNDAPGAGSGGGSDAGSGGVSDQG